MSGPKANLFQLKNARTVAETSATYCLAVAIQVVLKGFWEWETKVCVVLLQIVIRGQPTVSSVTTTLLVSR
jgi:hypothetical protein